MQTAEEFFRKKVKETQPNKQVITLSQELITAEQALRWAHEFAEEKVKNKANKLMTEINKVKFDINPFGEDICNAVRVNDVRKIIAEKILK